MVKTRFRATVQKVDRTSPPEALSAALAPPVQSSPTKAAEKIPAKSLESRSRPVATPKPAAAIEGAGQICLSPAERPAALAAIAKRVAACTRCDVLARTRTLTVFGVGNPCARLALLGEAPGADEDRQGEPFVGAAGHLLDKILAACTLRREDVYILNILRCRPPGNRTPLPEEAQNCREYLDAQLGIVRPEFICCLGACAAQNLLGTTTSIGHLRGRFHEYRSAKVICTYHPAYLLRNPSAKTQVWEDMQKLMAEMGISLPKR